MSLLPIVRAGRRFMVREVYPEGFSIRGIDVSHHQGVIDWEKLSKAQIGKDPISFVFIKATEGQDFLDENFNDNFYKARENGLYVEPIITSSRMFLLNCKRNIS